MYSAYKLNKQVDNIQPCCTPFPIWKGIIHHKNIWVCKQLKGLSMKLLILVSYLMDIAFPLTQNGQFFSLLLLLGYHVFFFVLDWPQNSWSHCKWLACLLPDGYHITPSQAHSLLQTWMGKGSSRSCSDDVGGSSVAWACVLEFTAVWS